MRCPLPQKHRHPGRLSTGTPCSGRVPRSRPRPTYTEADFRISQETADLIDGAPPANTSRTYNSALGQFRT
ncbi:hypothetical protein GCM10010358_67250 [Streptomyces minutiscleroticus]|uniref:Uncharacterized protein n=1 Tax=Streptomyces minutiscleroticus TaxID=68238 RepID=A0A918NXG7_9ACTN|nr:hypothetical protein GCM10010358_67250 [Streptomyces minutiscleroticus]